MDDIVITIEKPGDLEKILNDLNLAFQQVGQKMSMNKTKIMANSHIKQRPVIVDNTIIETVE